MIKITTKLTSAKPSAVPNVGREKFAVTVADGQTIGTSSGVAFNGYIKNYVADIAQCTGTTTVTVEFLDEDDTSMYSKAAIAENAKTHAVLTEDEEFNFAGIMRVKITQTNAQSGADASHNVIVYYSR